MPRALIAALAVALLGGAAWLWLQSPVESRPAAPAPTVEVIEPPPPPPPPAPPPRPAPAPVAAQDPAPPPPAAASADAGPPDAALAVADRYALGTHTVRLRSAEGEPPMELVVAPVLIARDPETLREIRLRRRQLIRMVFFLGSHRAAPAAGGADGEARFRADLLDRFRNVVRSGKVEDLELTRYEVQPVAEPDDGPQDEQ